MSARIANHSQPLAFRLNDQSVLPAAQAWTLAFPPEWRAAIVDHLNLRDDARLKMTSLNQSLRALLPDLIAINADADRSGDRPWLIASQPTDPSLIRMLVNAWIDGAYQDMSADRRRAAQAALSSREPVWRAREVTFGDWTTNAHGTALLDDSWFWALPHVMADGLTRDDAWFEIDGQRIQFRRAPPRFKSGGAELIAWPPLSVEERGQRWFYSVVVALTVQTVPFQSFPVVHCHMGLRRWISAPLAAFDLPDERCSIFLLTRVPWLEGTHATRAFQAAAARRRGKRVIWDDELPSILNALTAPLRSFPDPGAILADPTTALNLDGDWHAAATFSTRMDADHAVLPGVSAGYRRDLFAQIAGRLQAFVAPVDPWPRIAAPRNFAQRQPTPWDQNAQRLRLDGALAQEMRIHAWRRDMIAQALSDGKGRATKTTLTVEVYWQTKAMRHALIESLGEHLGIPAGERDQWQRVGAGDADEAATATAELDIVVRARPLGALGDKLRLPVGKRRDAAVRDAIRDRMQEIVGTLPEAGNAVIGALIELGGKRDFRDDDGNDCDPKDALRFGFARTGRLTQFIRPDDDDDATHRVTMSVRDLLRQLGLGVRVRRPNLVISGRLALLGFWMERDIPLVTRIDSQTRRVDVAAPLWDGWRPYPHALLTLAQATVRRQPRRNDGDDPKAAARRFLASVLTDLSEQDALLMARAQNARGAWPWLRNDRIAVDALEFLGASNTVGAVVPPSLRDHGFRRLRVVRVRDSEQHETPHVYAERAKGGASTPSGVFQMGARVFASLQERPAQVKDVRADAPLHARAWNQRVVEIAAAALQPDDDPQHWAHYVHRLRLACAFWDSATILPLPLHLAKKAHEYVWKDADSANGDV